MKLRLRGDSLRFRLTQSEVTALREEGWCQEETALSPADGPRLAYRLEVGQDTKSAVRFSAGSSAVVTAVLPAAEVNSWAGSSQVGLYFEESWGLKVAVEKDFRCLDPQRDEDESDNFENPLAGQPHPSGCDND